jgi:superoxide reductase
MSRIGDLYQTADWKSEKHVPVIECPDQAAADQFVDISVSLGKAVNHPNTTEHHIVWIKLYFKGEGDKFPYEIGYYQFSAHGASVEGPNTGPVYTDHSILTRVKLRKSGMLYASAYCNIHGLWESTKSITVA